MFLNLTVCLNNKCPNLKEFIHEIDFITSNYIYFIELYKKKVAEVLCRKKFCFY